MYSYLRLAYRLILVLLDLTLGTLARALRFTFVASNPAVLAFWLMRHDQKSRQE